VKQFTCYFSQQEELTVISSLGYFQLLTIPPTVTVPTRWHSTPLSQQSEPLYE